MSDDSTLGGFRFGQNYDPSELDTPKKDFGTKNASSEFKGIRFTFRLEKDKKKGVKLVVNYKGKEGEPCDDEYDIILRKGDINLLNDSEFDLDKALDLARNSVRVIAIHKQHIGDFEHISVEKGEFTETPNKGKWDTIKDDPNARVTKANKKESLSSKVNKVYNKIISSVNAPLASKRSGTLERRDDHERIDIDRRKDPSEESSRKKLGGGDDDGDNAAARRKKLADDIRTIGSPQEFSDSIDKLVARIKHLEEQIGTIGGSDIEATRQQIELLKKKLEELKESGSIQEDNEEFQKLKSLLLTQKQRLDELESIRVASSGDEHHDLLQDPRTLIRAFQDSELKLGFPLDDTHYDRSNELTPESMESLANSYAKEDAKEALREISSFKKDLCSNKENRFLPAYKRQVKMYRNTFDIKSLEVSKDFLKGLPSQAQGPVASFKQAVIKLRGDDLPELSNLKSLLLGNLHDCDLDEAAKDFISFFDLVNATDSSGEPKYETAHENWSSFVYSTQPRYEKDENGVKQAVYNFPYRRNYEIFSELIAARNQANSQIAVSITDAVYSTRLNALEEALEKVAKDSSTKAETKTDSHETRDVNDVSFDYDDASAHATPLDWVHLYQMRQRGADGERIFQSKKAERHAFNEALNADKLGDLGTAYQLSRSVLEDLKAEQIEESEKACRRFDETVEELSKDDASKIEHKALTTGDNLTAELRKQIAAGEVPDWDIDEELIEYMDRLVTSKGSKAGVVTALPGSGKTFGAKAFAKAVMEGKTSLPKGTQVIMLTKEIVEGINEPNMSFAGVLGKVIKKWEDSDPPVVIIADEAHNWMKKLSWVGSSSLMESLKTAVEEKKIRVIGLTTPLEYKVHFKDAAIIRRFPEKVVRDSLPEDIARRLQFSKEFVDRPEKVEYTPGQIYTASLLVKKYRSLASALADGDPNEKQEVSLVSRTLKSFDSMLTQAAKNGHSSLEIGDIVSTLEADNNVKLPIAEEDVEEYKLAGALFDIKHYFVKMVEEAFEGKNKIYLDAGGNSLLNNPEALKRKLKDIYTDFSTLTSSVGNKEVLAYSRSIAKALETAKTLLSGDDDGELDFIIESSLADGIQAVRIKKDKAEKDKAAIEQQTLSTHVAFTEGSYEAGKATRGAQELANLTYHKIPRDLCEELDSSLQGLLLSSSSRNITQLGVDSVVSDAKSKLEQFVDNQEEVYEKKRAILEQQQNLLEGEIAKIQAQGLDPIDENDAIYPYRKLFDDITISLLALKEAKAKVENRIQAFGEELGLLEEMSAHLKKELVKAKRSGAESLKLLLCTELEKPEDLTLEEAKRQSLLNFLKINLFSKFRDELKKTDKASSKQLEIVLSEADGGKPSCAADFTRLLRDGFSSILPDAKTMASEAPEHIPIYKKEEEVKDEESGEMKTVTYDSTDLLSGILDSQDNFDYYTPANIARNAFESGSKKSQNILALARFLKEIGLINEDKFEEIKNASTEDALRESLKELFITAPEVSSGQMDKRKVDAFLFFLYNLDKKAKSTGIKERFDFEEIKQLFGQEDDVLSTHCGNALESLDDHFRERPFNACFREQYFQLGFSKISWAKELSCVPGWEKKNPGKTRGVGNSSSGTSPVKGGSPFKRSPVKGGVEGQTEDFKAHIRKSPGKKTEKAEAFSTLKDALSNTVKEISSRGSLARLPLNTLRRYLENLLKLKKSVAKIKENYDQAEAFCTHWEAEIERLRDSLKLLIAIQEKIASRADAAQNELIGSKLTEEERSDLPAYFNRKESEVRSLASTIHSNLDGILNEVQLEFKLAAFNLEARQEEMKKANAKEREELEARIFKEGVIQKLGAFKRDESLAKEVRRQGKQLAKHAQEIIRLGEGNRSISQILDLIRNVRARVEVNTRDIEQHSKEQEALLEEAQKAGLDRARIERELSELAAVREKEQVELQAQLEELTSIYESDREKFEAQQEETHKLVAGMLDFRAEELDSLEGAEDRIAAMREKFEELSRADSELQALGEQADKSVNLQRILDAKEELKRQMQLKMQELENKKDDLTRKIEAADRDISGKISAAKTRISDLQGQLEEAVEAAEKGIAENEDEAEANFKRLQTSLRKELAGLIALEIKRPSTTNVHELYEQYEKHVADMNRSLEVMVQDKEGDVKTYLEEAEAEFTTLREQLTEEFSKVAKRTLKRPSTENVAKYNRLLQERQAFYEREIEKLKAKGEVEAEEKYKEALRELSEQYTSISDELQTAVDSVKVSALKRPSLETINHYQEMLKLKRTTLQKEIETLTELKTREAQERLAAATAELEAQFQNAKENIDTVLAKVKVEAIDRPSTAQIEALAEALSLKRETLQEELSRYQGTTEAAALERKEAIERELQEHFDTYKGQLDTALSKVAVDSLEEPNCDDIEAMAKAVQEKRKILQDELVRLKDETTAEAERRKEAISKELDKDFQSYQKKIEDALAKVAVTSLEDPDTTAIEEIARVLTLSRTNKQAAINKLLEENTTEARSRAARLEQELEADYAKYSKKIGDALATVAAEKLEDPDVTTIETLASNVKALRELKQSEINALLEKDTDEARLRAAKLTREIEADYTLYTDKISSSLAKVVANKLGDPDVSSIETAASSLKAFQKLKQGELTRLLEDGVSEADARVVRLKGEIEADFNRYSSKISEALAAVAADALENPDITSIQGLAKGIKDLRESKQRQIQQLLSSSEATAHARAAKLKKEVQEDFDRYSASINSALEQVQVEALERPDISNIEALSKAAKLLREEKQAALRELASDGTLEAQRKSREIERQLARDFKKHTQAIRKAINKVTVEQLENPDVSGIETIVQQVRALRESRQEEISRLLQEGTREARQKAGAIEKELSADFKLFSEHIAEAVGQVKTEKLDSPNLTAIRELSDLVKQRRDHLQDEIARLLAEGTETARTEAAELSVRMMREFADHSANIQVAVQEVTKGVELSAPDLTEFQTLADNLRKERDRLQSSLDEFQRAGLKEGVRGAEHLLAGLNEEARIHRDKISQALAKIAADSLREPDLEDIEKIAKFVKDERTRLQSELDALAQASGAEAERRKAEIMTALNQDFESYESQIDDALTKVAVEVLKKPDLKKINALAKQVKEQRELKQQQLDSYLSSTEDGARDKAAALLQKMGEDSATYRSQIDAALAGVRVDALSAPDLQQLHTMAKELQDHRQLLQTQLDDARVGAIDAAGRRKDEILSSLDSSYESLNKKIHDALATVTAKTLELGSLDSIEEAADLVKKEHARLQGELDAQLATAGHDAEARATEITTALLEQFTSFSRQINEAAAKVDAKALSAPDLKRFEELASSLATRRDTLSRQIETLREKGLSAAEAKAIELLEKMDKDAATYKTQIQEARDAVRVDMLDEPDLTKLRNYAKQLQDRRAELQSSLAATLDQATVDGKAKFNRRLGELDAHYESQLDAIQQAFNKIAVEDISAPDLSKLQQMASDLERERNELQSQLDAQVADANTEGAERKEAIMAKLKSTHAAYSLRIQEALDKVVERTLTEPDLSKIEEANTLIEQERSRLQAELDSELTSADEVAQQRATDALQALNKTFEDQSQRIKAALQSVLTADATLSPADVSKMEKLARDVSKKKLELQAKLNKLEEAGNTAAAEKAQELLGKMDEDFTTYSEAIDAAVAKIQGELSAPNIERINAFAEAVKVQKEALQKQLDDLAADKTEEAEAKKNAILAKLAQQSTEHMATIQAAFEKVSADSLSAPDLSAMQKMAKDLEAERKQMQQTLDETLSSSNAEAQRKKEEILEKLEKQRDLYLEQIQAAVATVKADLLDAPNLEKIKGYAAFVKEERKRIQGEIDEALSSAEEGAEKKAADLKREMEALAEEYKTAIASAVGSIQAELDAPDLEKIQAFKEAVDERRKLLQSEIDKLLERGEEAAERRAGELKAEMQADFKAHTKAIRDALATVTAEKLEAPSLDKINEISENLKAHRNKLQSDLEILLEDSEMTAEERAATIQQALDEDFETFKGQIDTALAAVTAEKLKAPSLENLQEIARTLKATQESYTDEIARYYSMQTEKGEAKAAELTEMLLSQKTAIEKQISDAVGAIEVDDLETPDLSAMQRLRQGLLDKREVMQAELEAKRSEATEAARDRVTELEGILEKQKATIESAISAELAKLKQVNLEAPDLSNIKKMYTAYRKQHALYQKELDRLPEEKTAEIEEYKRKLKDSYTEMKASMESELSAFTEKALENPDLESVREAYEAYGAHFTSLQEQLDQMPEEMKGDITKWQDEATERFAELKSKIEKELGAMKQKVLKSPSTKAVKELYDAYAESTHQYQGHLDRLVKDKEAEIGRMQDDAEQEFAELKIALQEELAAMTKADLEAHPERAAEAYAKYQRNVAKKQDELDIAVEEKRAQIDGWNTELDTEFTSVKASLKETLDSFKEKGLSADTAEVQRLFEAYSANVDQKQGAINSQIKAQKDKIAGWETDLATEFADLKSKLDAQVAAMKAKGLRDDSPAVTQLYDKYKEHVAARQTALDERIRLEEEKIAGWETNLETEFAELDASLDEAFESIKEKGLTADTSEIQRLYRSYTAHAEKKQNALSAMIEAKKGEIAKWEKDLERESTRLQSELNEKLAEYGERKLTEPELAEVRRLYAEYEENLQSKQASLDLKVQEKEAQIAKWQGKLETDFLEASRKLEESLNAFREQDLSEPDLSKLQTAYDAYTKNIEEKQGKINKLIKDKTDQISRWEGEAEREFTRMEAELNTRLEALKKQGFTDSSAEVIEAHEKYQAKVAEKQGQLDAKVTAKKEEIARWEETLDAEFEATKSQLEAELSKLEKLGLAANTDAVKLVYKTYTDNVARKQAALDELIEGKKEEIAEWSEEANKAFVKLKAELKAELDALSPEALEANPNAVKEAHKRYQAKVAEKQAALDAKIAEKQEQIDEWERNLVDEFAVVDARLTASLGEFKKLDLDESGIEKLETAYASYRDNIQEKQGAINRMIQEKSGQIDRWKTDAETEFSQMRGELETRLRAMEKLGLTADTAEVQGLYDEYQAKVAEKQAALTAKVAAKTAEIAGWERKLVEDFDAQSESLQAELDKLQEGELNPADTKKLKVLYKAYRENLAGKQSALNDLVKGKKDEIATWQQEADRKFISLQSELQLELAALGKQGLSADSAEVKEAHRKYKEKVAAKQAELDESIAAQKLKIKEWDDGIEEEYSAATAKLEATFSKMKEGSLEVDDKELKEFYQSYLDHLAEKQGALQGILDRKKEEISEWRKTANKEFTRLEAELNEKLAKYEERKLTEPELAEVRDLYTEYEELVAKKQTTLDQQIEDKKAEIGEFESRLLEDYARREEELTAQLDEFSKLSLGDVNLGELESAYKAYTDNIAAKQAALQQQVVAKQEEIEDWKSKVEEENRAAQLALEKKLAKYEKLGIEVPQADLDEMYADYEKQIAEKNRALTEAVSAKEREIATWQDNIDSEFETVNTRLVESLKKYKELGLEDPDQTQLKTLYKAYKQNATARQKALDKMVRDKEAEIGVYKDRLALEFTRLEDKLNAELGKFSPEELRDPDNAAVQEAYRKYQAAKDEAQAKLDGRVSDKTKEIEEWKGQLEKKAEVLNRELDAAFSGLDELDDLVIDREKLLKAKEDWRKYRDAHLAKQEALNQRIDDKLADIESWTDADEEEFSRLQGELSAELSKLGRMTLDKPDLTKCNEAYAAYEKQIADWQAQLDQVPADKKAEIQEWLGQAKEERDRIHEMMQTDLSALKKLNLDSFLEGLDDELVDYARRLQDAGQGDQDILQALLNKLAQDVKGVKTSQEELGIKLDAEIAKVREDFAREVERLEATLANHKSRIDGHDATLANHEARIKLNADNIAEQAAVAREMARSIELVKEELASLRSEQAELERKLEEDNPDAETKAKLEEALEQLRQHQEELYEHREILVAQNDQIEQNIGRLDGHDDEIDELRGLISSNSAAITTMGEGLRTYIEKGDARGLFGLIQNEASKRAIREELAKGFRGLFPGSKGAAKVERIGRRVGKTLTCANNLLRKRNADGSYTDVTSADIPALGLDKFASLSREFDRELNHLYNVAQGIDKIKDPHNRMKAAQDISLRVAKYVDYFAMIKSKIKVQYSDGTEVEKSAFEYYIEHLTQGLGKGQRQRERAGYMRMIQKLGYLCDTMAGIAGGDASVEEGGTRFFQIFDTEFVGSRDAALSLDIGRKAAVEARGFRSLTEHFASTIGVTKRRGDFRSIRAELEGVAVIAER